MEDISSIAEAAGELKSAVYRRLKRYWWYVEPIRDELVRKAKREGLSKDQAQLAAYTELDERFPEGWTPPEGEEAPQPVPFQGYRGDVDELIDPDYHEADAGNRLRDSYVWVGDEFRRITDDQLDRSKCPPEQITTMRFERAHTRPPTVLAVQIAEYYGEHKQKRSELLNRLASFAAKAHDTKEATTEQQEAGYLDSLG